MSFKAARFPKNPDFITTLRSRVDDYFKKKRISKFGNAEMIIKTVILISFFAVSYALIISGLVTNVWLLLGLWLLMGVGVAGIGLSIMHDACHGAYSKYKWVNKLLSYSMNIVGGSSLNWTVQHNVLHHSFTNIDSMDEDIHPGMIIRLSPHQKRRKLHRLQHIYSWFFYGGMTLSWVFVKDFRQLFRHKRRGLIKYHKKPFGRLFLEILASKVVYYAYMIALPMIFSPAAWWQTGLFFVAMHFVTGMILACVFQPAHVVPITEFPIPDEKGFVEKDWAFHQLSTTTNFAPRSRIFSWFIGGLNYQVEHHLFPKICHVHYRKLAKIAKKTAQEFGLPYHSQPNFLVAVWNHAKMLRKLGKYEVIPT